MANTYADATLTEAMLSNEYAENGVVFIEESDAKLFLKRKGFAMLDGVYRGKHAKTATIYRLRDSILDTKWPHKPVKFIPKGYLVSFGGEPKSCYDLKFTKIVKPRA